MSKYNHSQTGEIRETLAHSYIHDAVIESINYDRGSRRITVEATNRFYKYHYVISFEEVRQVFYSVGDFEYGSWDTIHSVTIEPDSPSNIPCGNNEICVCFQMLSMDEVYIISKTISFFEKTKR